MSRRFALPALLLSLLAACGGDSTGPDDGGPPAGAGIGQATVGTGGGILTVTDAGSRMHGMTITVPAGAYTASTQLTVRKSTVTAPVLSGGRIGSDVVSIESNGAAYTAGKPLELSVPVAYGPNEYPFVMLFDPATGERTVLPSIPVAGSRVVAETRLLDGKLIRPTASASLRHANALMADHPIIHLVIGVVPMSELAKDQDSGYRPEVDDWEFDRILTAVMNEQYRYASAAAITAAWYYERFKASRGPLHGRFQKAPGIQSSNRDGLRLVTSLIDPMDQHIPAVLEYRISLLTAMIKFEATNFSMDSLTLLSVKAGLYTTGRPQILMGTDLDADDAPNVMLIAYRTRGSTIDVSLGTSVAGPNAPRTLTLVNGDFSPISWASLDPGDEGYTIYHAKNILATGQTATLPAGLLNSSWQELFDGTIGKGIWPDWRMATKTERPVKDTLFIGEDSIRVWLECPECEASLPVGPGITPQGNVVLGAMARRSADGKWARVANMMDENGVLFKDETDGYHMGVIVLEPDADGAMGYLDWYEFEVKVRKLEITPKDKEIKPNEKLTLTATMDRNLPTAPTWEWELGDGRKITTQTNTIEIEYPPPAGGNKEYEVKARLKSGAAAYATGKTKVIVKGGGSPHWKITSIADTEGFFDDEDVGGGGNEVRDTFLRLLSTPGAGMISLDEVTGGTALRLRVLKSTQWNPETQCCPPPAPSGAEYVPFILGTKPPVSFAVGPFFSAWNSSNWNQSSDDLNTGTMTGQYVHSTMTYNIKDRGTQTGPTGGIRISATRNGTTMTGTISITIWWIDDESGEVDSDPETYAFPFTAVRMK